MYTIKYIPSNIDSAINVISESFFYETPLEVIPSDEFEVGFNEYITSSQMLQNGIPTMIQNGRPIEYPPPDAYSDWINFEWITNEIKLQEARDRIWLEIKATRDYRKSSGILVGDYWYQSDDSSRIQQLAIVMLGPNIPPDLLWKTKGGEFVIMTQLIASQIFSNTCTSDKNIFYIAESHKTDMYASADPLNYDYSTNWPPMYGEINNADN